MITGLIGVAEPREDQILLSEQKVINKSKGLVTGSGVVTPTGVSALPLRGLDDQPFGNLTFGRFTKDPDEALECFMLTASRLRTETLRVRTKSRRKRRRS